MNSTALILALTSLLPGQDTSVSAAPGGIVAIVGDEVITRSDLEKEFSLRRADVQPLSQTALEEEKKRYFTFLLQRMIDDLLILQEARRLETQRGQPYVPWSMVDAQIEADVKKRREDGDNILTVDDLYRRETERTGLSRNEIRDLYREEMMRRRYLSDEIFLHLDPWVRPKEMEYYYKSRILEFSTPMEVTFRQILIQANRFVAPEIMKQVEEGLAQGTDFLELAKSFSEDRGRLWVKNFKELEESWFPPIPEQLRKMREGEISRPLQTEIGIHYLKLEQRVDGKPISYEEAQPKITERILQERRANAAKKLLADLRAKTRIENFLAPEPPAVAGTESEPKDPAGGSEASKESAAPGEAPGPPEKPAAKSPE